MKRLLSKLIAVAMIVGLLSVLGANLALAQTANPGQGADTAMAPAGNWQQLAVGQSHWYAFQYQAQNDDTGVDTTFTIRLSTIPGSSAGFDLWSPESLQAATDDDRRPAGRGTQQRNAADDLLYDGDLLWTGSFRISGTYYVVVNQNGGAPSTYRLTVSGAGVSFPGADAAMAQGNAGNLPPPVTLPQAGSDQSMSGASPAAGSPSAAAGQQAAPASAGQGTAAASNLPSGNWTPLGLGQQQWYVIPNPGTDTLTQIRMGVDPANSATFSVWTAEQLRGANSGEDPTSVNARAVGNGTQSRDADDNLLFGGDLVWVGNVRSADVLYVGVQQTGSVAGNFRMTFQQQQLASDDNGDQTATLY